VRGSILQTVNIASEPYKSTCPARPSATCLKYSIGAATFQKLCPWKSGLEIKSGPGARDLNRSRYGSHHISGLQGIKLSVCRPGMVQIMVEHLPLNSLTIEICRYCWLQTVYKYWVCKSSVLSE